MAQGGNWDIRGLIHSYWPWMIGFVIVYVLSGVLVYFRLRRPRDKRGATGKSA
jgi:hypothetical protein